MKKSFLAVGAAVSLATVALVLARDPDRSRASSAPRDAGSVAARESRRELDSEPAPAVTGDERRPLGHSSDGAGTLTVLVQTDCPAVSSAWVWLSKSGVDGRRRGQKLEGSSTFDALETGSYVIEVEGGGYEFVRREVTIEAGVDRTELVEGKALNRLAGTVADRETRLPISEFLVRVQAREDSNVPTYRSFLQHPFSGGRFCLEGVRPVGETMRLHFVSAGYEPRVSEWFPIGSKVDELHFEMVATSSVVGHLEGRVVSAVDGTGVVDAELWFADLETPLASAFVLGSTLQMAGGEIDLLGLVDPERNRGRSGADGAFRIEVDLSVVRKLLVYHRDYFVAESEPIAMTPERADQHVDLYLTVGAFIRGRVLSSPEENPRISVLEVIGPERNYYLNVDADGTFRQGGLVDGAYTLRLHVIREHATGEETTVLAASELAVIDAGRDAEVTFHLGSGLVGATVAGEVVLPGDAGIHEWMVAVLDPRQLGRGLIRTAAPDSEGRFELDSVPDGELLLFLVGWSPDHAQWAATGLPLEVRGGQCPSVTLDASAPRIGFELPGYEATGTPGRLAVTSQEGLFAVLPEGSITLFLDTEGRAVLFGLPPGEYTATLSGAGSEIPLGFSVAAGTPGERQILLE